MNTQKPRIANKIAYVERWNMHFKEGEEFDIVDATQLPNGRKGAIAAPERHYL